MKTLTQRLAATLGLTLIATMVASAASATSSEEIRSGTLSGLHAALESLPASGKAQVDTPRSTADFGETLDADTRAAFPSADAYLTGLTVNAGQRQDGHTWMLVTSTGATKQERSYWCGPASLAFMARHDPVVKDRIDLRQSQWAAWAGTTEAGSNIRTLRDQINLRLTGWADRVGDYGVFSIRGWSLSDWGARFVTTTERKMAPILLHPKLTPQNSSYIPERYATGGHFNVGVGWKTGSTGNYAWIFEPYAADGSVKKLLWESLSNVREQNLANTNHQNIAY